MPESTTQLSPLIEEAIQEIHDRQGRGRVSLPARVLRAHIDERMKTDAEFRAHINSLSRVKQIIALMEEMNLG